LDEKVRALRSFGGSLLGYGSSGNLRGLAGKLGFPLNGDLSLDVDGILGSVNERTRIEIIARPTSQTCQTLNELSLFCSIILFHKGFVGHIVTEKGSK